MKKEQENPELNIQQKKEEKNKFDPYAPHRIKWWGWPLLLLLIAGTVYIIKTHDQGKQTATTPTAGKAGRRQRVWHLLPHNLPIGTELADRGGSHLAGS